jgi:glycosyltransferase involved in cell wall biosynthesis
MLTILHTIDTTGPGGAETVFIELATHLPRDKFRSVVIIRGKGWVYEELRRRGIEPILLEAKGSFNWRYLLKLRTIIKHEHVDVIQSHLLGSNVYCALAGLLTRRPVVATFHGTVDVDDQERFLGLKFGAINLGVKHVVAVSENLRQNLIKRTPISSRKLTVIYNGIETERFNRPRAKSLREQFGWGKDDVLVGSLGNIRPAKGYNILLEAAALLKSSQITFRFLIAGEGKPGLQEKLHKQRSDLGLEDSVHFLGFQENPAVFLANLDLFLLSSISEGFSIATIQAMASGLPVIVTRSGGPQEIVTHGEDGWMVEAGRPEAIAEALTLLAREPGLCTKLAQNGKQRAKGTFDLSTMLAGYQELYQRP